VSGLEELMEQKDRQHASGDERVEDEEEKRYSFSRVWFPKMVSQRLESITHGLCWPLYRPLFKRVPPPFFFFLVFGPGPGQHERQQQQNKMSTRRQSTRYTSGRAIVPKKKGKLSIYPIHLKYKHTHTHTIDCH
jgi:hypothetical protein